MDFGSLMERPMLGQGVGAAVQAKAVVVGDFRPFTDRSRLAGFDPNRVYRAIRIHSREAVIGPGDPAIDGRRVQWLGVRSSSPSASDCGCASAPRLAGATSWPERDGQTYSE